MREDKEYKVVLFPSTAAAMRGEKLTREKGYPVKLVPTPRHLSSDCGVCLRVDGGKITAVKELFEENTVPVKGYRSLTEA